MTCRSRTGCSLHRPPSMPSSPSKSPAHLHWRWAIVSRLSTASSRSARIGNVMKAAAFTPPHESLYNDFRGNSKSIFVRSHAAGSHARPTARTAPPAHRSKARVAITMPKLAPMVTTNTHATRIAGNDIMMSTQRIMRLSTASCWSRPPRQGRWRCSRHGARKTSSRTVRNATPCTRR